MERNKPITNTELTITEDKIQSIKKKIFKMDKMERLVHQDLKLSKIYFDLSQEEGYWGFHKNENILAHIFNEYVMNDSKYLLKYKMAKSLKKDRRDETGIRAIESEFEKKLRAQRKEDEKIENVEESTGASSSGSFSASIGYDEKQVNETTGASASGSYGTPFAFSKTGKPQNTLKMPGSTTVQIYESEYLTNPKAFKLLFESICEEDEKDMINYISNNSDAYGNETKNMSKADIDIIDTDLKSHVWDRANLQTESSSIDDNPNSMISDNPNSMIVDKENSMANTVVSTTTKSGVENTLSTGSNVQENKKQKIDKMSKEINESIDTDNYESVIFLDGSEADEAFEILNNDGEYAAMEYLKQWHDYGNHMGQQELGHGTSDETYEKDGYIMSWNSRIGYIGLEYDLNYDSDLENLKSDVQESENLVNAMRGLLEDKKPSSLIMLDRLQAQNKKNFKTDFSHSGTSKIVDDEDKLDTENKENLVDLENPYELGEDLEKDELKSMTKGEGLKNVGDSQGKNNEIPKRNQTDKESKEIDGIRAGMHTWDIYGNNDSYEKKMKESMGDFYDKRQEYLKQHKNQPMYNKDKQPVTSESLVYGKYKDELGRVKFVDFNLNEAINVTKITNDCKKISFDGLGNKYDRFCQNINESVESNLNTNDYYINDNNEIIKVIKTNVLNESTNVKPKTESFEKIKHLFNYKPNTYIDNSSTKSKRCF